MNSGNNGDPVPFSLIVERPLGPSDLHATLLHALGLDQHRVIFGQNNRDEIPTNLGGEVVREVFA